jgi:hypothetical protein
MKAPLRMWTIYEHPKDYPESHVARLFEVTEDGPRATPSIIISPSLEFLREQMVLMGLTVISRSKQDDPVIIEVWL